MAEHEQPQHGRHRSTGSAAATVNSALSDMLLDRAIERFVIYTPIGALAGISLAFLLPLRYRGTLIGLGTGIGLGLAWGHTRGDYARHQNVYPCLWKASSSRPHEVAQ